MVEPAVEGAPAHEYEDDIRVSLERELESRFDWDEVRRENGLYMESRVHSQRPHHLTWTNEN